MLNSCWLVVNKSFSLLWIWFLISSSESSRETQYSASQISHSHFFSKQPMKYIPKFTHVSDMVQWLTMVLLPSSVALWFVAVIVSVVLYSYVIFTHIFQGYITGTGTIIWLPQCQWRNPERYGYNGPILYHNKTQQNLNHEHFLGHTLYGLIMLIVDWAILSSLLWFALWWVGQMDYRDLLRLEVCVIPMTKSRI